MIKITEMAKNVYESENDANKWNIVKRTKKTFAYLSFKGIVLIPMYVRNRKPIIMSKTFKIFHPLAIFAVSTVLCN